MARIIIASTPARGHLTPLRSIAGDLVRRGHEVVMTSASVFREGIEATGARFVPLGGAADFDSDAEERERAKNDPLPPGPAKHAHDIQWMITDPIPAQHATLQALLAESEEPTALIVENGFYGAWPTLTGAPGRRPEAVIVIGISPVTVLSVDTAPFGFGLPPDASPQGRERNAVLNAQIRDLLSQTSAGLQKAVDEVGGGEAPFIFDGQLTLADRFFQLAPASVEYPRSDASNALRYIGPLPAAPVHDAALPAWWSDVEQAEHVVVVTQGTVANGDLTALVQTTFDALADREDLLVVAATGREDADELTPPANARVGGFIPFELLLPRAEVLVTNGGYGGSLQALSHGVPLVLAGDTEDKIEGTARLAWSGAGVNLATGHPTVEAVREAVTTVLSEPRFTQGARRVQAEIAAHRPYDEIEDAVLELLAHSATTEA